MALTEDELRAAYSTLSAATQECGLGWVVQQVEERIAVGKTTIEKVAARVPDPVSARAPELVEGDRKRRGAPASFVTSEAYSSTESLALLVDALLVAVPTVHQVARHTLSGLREFGPIDSMVFAPDVPSSRPYEMRSEELETRSRSVLRVEKLLNELQVELKDASEARSS